MKKIEVGSRVVFKDHHGKIDTETMGTGTVVSLDAPHWLVRWDSRQGVWAYTWENLEVL